MHNKIDGKDHHKNFEWGRGRHKKPMHTPTHRTSFDVVMSLHGCFFSLYRSSYLFLSPLSLFLFLSLLLLALFLLLYISLPLSPFYSLYLSPSFPLFLFYVTLHFFRFLFLFQFHFYFFSKYLTTILSLFSLFS